MTTRLRIAFMGTPDFTGLALDELIASGHEVVCVYTQPPRPKGRGQSLQKTPVHVQAEAAGIPVRTPANFKNEDDLRAFEALDLDIAVVAGFGMILPSRVLEAPRHGCLNIHPSLLPRWRGVAPVQFAVWNGDAETGVCLMRLDEKMDTGPIIACSRTDIAPDDTAETLNARLWPLGAKLLADAVRTLFETGRIEETPQASDGATYTRFLTKADGRVDWQKSAAEIDRQVRALNPWPGAWCEDGQGGRLKILAVRPLPEKTTAASGTVIGNLEAVACGNGSALGIISLQPEGKRAMNFSDALHGKILVDGQVLA